MKKLKQEKNNKEIKNKIIKYNKKELYELENYKN